MLRKLTDVRVVGSLVSGILHTGIFFRKEITIYKHTFTKQWWTEAYGFQKFTPKQNKKLEKLYNRSAYD